MLRQPIRLSNNLNLRRLDHHINYLLHSGHKPISFFNIQTAAFSMKMDQPPVPPPKSQLAQDLSLANSSAKLPRLIYGTAWKGDETAEMVYQALKAGFRAIDTAAQPKHYKEHLVAEGVKRAIAEGIVTREDIFVSYVRFFTR